MIIPYELAEVIIDEAEKIAAAEENMRKLIEDKRPIQVMLAWDFLFIGVSCSLIVHNYRFKNCENSAAKTQGSFY